MSSYPVCSPENGPCKRVNRSPSSTAGVTETELLFDPLGVETARGKQYVAVKPEVGKLLDKPFIGVGDCRQRDLYPLLAHLLSHSGGSARE